MALEEDNNSHLKRTLLIPTACNSCRRQPRTDPQNSTEGHKAKVKTFKVGS